MIAINWFITALAVVSILGGIIYAIYAHNHESYLSQKNCLDRGNVWLQVERPSDKSSSDWSCMPPEKVPAIK